MRVEYGGRSEETVKISTIERVRVKAHGNGGANPRAVCRLYALVALILAAGWQATTVHFNYHGNWTALFSTGDRKSVPPELSSGTFVFANSFGYDGQFYRYVAHDPWIRSGWWKYHDAPALRYSRILVPSLAWALAGGQAPSIDGAYILVVLLCILAGTYYLSRYAAMHGQSPAWGLGFLLVPGTLISIDRLTIDVALVALCAAWVWYVRTDSPVRLYVVLMLAGLCRETGLLLAGACCLSALWNRSWRKAAIYATAALPAFAWYGFVLVQVGPAHVQAKVLGSEWLFRSPLIGIFIALFHPAKYPFGSLLNQTIAVLDVIALCGMLATLAVGAWSLRKWPLNLERWAAMTFLCLIFAVSAPGFWINVYGYARPFSPLFLLVGLGSLSGGSRWALMPLLMLDIRIAAQWAPQVYGVLHGLRF